MTRMFIERNTVFFTESLQSIKILEAYLYQFSLRFGRSYTACDNLLTLKISKDVKISLVWKLKLIYKFSREQCRNWLLREYGDLQKYLRISIRINS